MNSIKFFSLGAFILTVCSVSAQTDCVGDRYANPNYFANVKVTSNVVYGSNKSVGNGTPQTLRLDVYEPEGDTLPNRPNRPLIILAHGGSFVGGGRSEAVPLCNSFAKMGYVAVTIDYRTGFFFPNQVTTTLAVMRAMHDMKAAVRFFRKDAADVNTYAIDTNRIIIGGISAGAITAIQAAYLDQESEIPAYLANDTAGLGGIEGLSGNPGYSSKAVAVVNYAGAIGDTSWIVAGDIPITSFHYAGDVTVPYDTREVNVQGIPTGLVASGSGDMKPRLDHVGVTNELRTFSGTGHVDFLSDADYDSVVYSTMMFLYDNVVCKNKTGLIALNNSKGKNIEISPNPSNGKFVVRLSEKPESPVEISIYNSVGQLVYRKENKVEPQVSLELEHMNKGLYVVAIEDKNAVTSIQKLVIQ